MSRKLTLRSLGAVTALILLLTPTAYATDWDRPLTVADVVEDSGVRWLGADDQVLPFRTDEEVLAYLQTADVVDSKRLAEGINKALKLTLESNGIRAHAIFKTVQRELHDDPSNRPSFYRAVDSYIHEVAAYELSRILGLDRIPPTVLREIDGERGALQLWVENAMTEAALIERGRADEGAAQRVLQKQNMFVFDQLIYNFDRHQGNSLYDSFDYLWYIDHTRSFKSLPQAPDLQRIAVVDRTMLESLRQLDIKTLRRELSPYLDVMQINSLERRRRQILRRVDTLIETRGVDAVVVDIEGATRTLTLARESRASSGTV
jgi:hypothetical protein